MSSYYNEFDPKAAVWLRELIAAGLIPFGDVDERSITEVQAHELKGYTQCHFFAGIGGWPEALRLAGWPPDRPIWTGSCPCQSLSVAGLGRGADDKRHLWPHFARLISECEPSIVAGEQVASKLGRQWLAGIQADLEAMGYITGAADLCAAGVGSPHIRQRLWWVADATSSQLRQKSPTGHECPDTQDRQANERMADPSPEQHDGTRDTGARGRNEHPDGGSAGRLANSVSPRLERHARDGADSNEPGRQQEEQARSVAESSHTGWGGVLHYCRDGKARRIPAIESSVQFMADGIPKGMDDGGDPGDAEMIPDLDLYPLAPKLPGATGLLKGAGNAIVPQIGAEFIKAFMEIHQSRKP